MDTLGSTEELLGQDKREILIWHHRLNHFYFKYLLRLSNRVIISRNLSKIRPPLPLCRLLIWKSPQEAMEDQRQNLRRVNQVTLRDQTRRHDLN